MYIEKTIKKDVTSCQECPYIVKIPDMGATLFFCGALKYPNDFLTDISRYAENISKKCPFNT